VAFGDELVLRRLRVHKYDVGVAAPRKIERLACAERDDAHLYAGLLLEQRQDMLEKPRLFGRRGRRDGYELLSKRGRNTRERAQRDG
jgi:hypothetical protein